MMATTTGTKLIVMLVKGMHYDRPHHLGSYEDVYVEESGIHSTRPRNKVDF